MSRGALIAAASLCLGLGLMDLAYLNLRLVPAAVQGEPRPAVSATASRGDGGVSGSEAVEPVARVERPAVPRARATRESGPVVIPFMTGSARLTESARDELDRIARVLDGSSSARARIAGHADERGSREYNEALGARRARRVARYLIGRGVDPARLKTLSLGESRPRSRGRDPASLRENRRVEISLRRGEP